MSYLTKIRRSYPQILFCTPSSFGKNQLNRLVSFEIPVKMDIPQTLSMINQDYVTYWSG